MRRVFLLITSVALLSCNQDQEHTAKQNLFGQEVKITLYAADRRLARRALDAVTEDLKLIDSYTDVQKSRPMLRLNSMLQSREWFSMNPSLYKLTKLSQDYYQKTDAAFNPAALGAMRQAWDFYQKTPNPDLKKINSLLKQDLSMQDIEINGIRVRGRKTQLRLDFDLLAIGYAIDSQLEHLAELGIEQAVLRIGPVTGSLGTVAQTIVINDRSHVDLKPDEAICQFSASDSRFPRHGRIDPRSAWPVKPIPTVTVIHGDASTASVACAALLVANEGEWNSLLQNLGLTYARWQRGDREYITSALRARVVTAGDTKAGKKGKN